MPHNLSPLPKTWRVPRRSMAVVAVHGKGHLTSGGRIDLTRDAVIRSDASCDPTMKSDRGHSQYGSDGDCPGIGRIMPLGKGQIYIGDPVKAMIEPRAERAVVDCTGTWSSRSAPRRDHRIFCDLFMRRFTRKFAVPSVIDVPPRSPARQHVRMLTLRLWPQWCATVLGPAPCQHRLASCVNTLRT